MANGLDGGRRRRLNEQGWLLNKNDWLGLVSVRGTGIVGQVCVAESIGHGCVPESLGEKARARLKP